MRVYLFSTLYMLFVCGTTFGQGKTIAERLGYADNAKLLIIHADDLGVSHSENMASIRGLEETPVNSASIMVPCPWFPEIASYAKENSSTDFGLHLTLNSEWINYKWGPVTARDSVSSIVNDKGYLYPQIQDVVTNGKPEEVALELRNQIKKAYKFDIDVTHLDAHMGTAVSSVEFLESYIKLGKEYGLPVLLDHRMELLKEPQIEVLLDEQVIVANTVYTANPPDYDTGMAQYYTKVLNNLDEGLNTILIHLAYDDSEMKAITVEHEYWHSPWRQADVDFFGSSECKALIEKNNITLVTWRKLRDKIVRGE